MSDLAHQHLPMSDQLMVSTADLKCHHLMEQLTVGPDNKIHLEMVHHLVTQDKMEQKLKELVTEDQPTMLYLLELELQLLLVLLDHQEAMFHQD